MQKLQKYAGECGPHPYLGSEKNAGIFFGFKWRQYVEAMWNKKEGCIPMWLETLVTESKHGEKNTRHEGRGMHKAPADEPHTLSYGWG